MPDKAPPTVETEIVSETTICTLDEICTCCDANREWIATIVEHGIIEPIGDNRTNWRFTRISAVRAAKARRLERDLGLNPPGIALTLDLLDEIERLKARLKGLGLEQ